MRVVRTVFVALVAAGSACDLAQIRRRAAAGVAATAMAAAVLFASLIAVALGLAQVG